VTIDIARINRGRGYRLSLGVENARQRAIVSHGCGKKQDGTPSPEAPLGVTAQLRRRAEVSGTLRQSAFVYYNSDRRAQGSSRSVSALVSERACDLLKALLQVQ
jgi:hypothetical protein